MLWECLQPGQHEFTEEGITATLEPQAGETVLFFNIDCTAFRQGQHALRICDLLVFYRGAAHQLPVLLFVELKGSDYERAESQIMGAARRVLAELDPLCGGIPPAKAAKGTLAPGSSVNVRAVVLCGSSLLFKRKERQKDLYQQTGLLFRYHSEARRQPNDLREHLS
jgi:hypothetical protein